jgi:hypothetical protein
MPSLFSTLRTAIFGEPNIAMHPRETLVQKGLLAVNGAVFFVDSDGCSTVAIDLRGTFNLTVEVSGTVDGVNWSLIPMRPINQNAILWVSAIAGTTTGIWVGKCAKYRRVRARVIAYTSGSSAAVLACDNGNLDDALLEGMTTALATTTSAAGAAATLTLPSPGAGLRVACTYLSFNRFATSDLVAAAAPVLLTSTNLPGNLAITLSAEALLQGQVSTWREDLAYALAAVSQNTAVTFVAPAVPSVIWRLTAGFKIVT